MKIFLGIVALVLLAAQAAAAAGTLDRIRSSGEFRIGYRADAAPFAYDSPSGEPAGYQVDLCREVADAAQQQLGLDALKLDYVKVTAEDRFEAVKEGRIDILCDPATVTVSRRAMVDFSLLTFIDGASVLFRVDGPQGFDALAGQKVGVHAGTTTEAALRKTLADIKIDAEIVLVDDHADGLKRLESGEFAAYFADRAILTFLLAESGAQDKLKLSEQYFSQEPYALALAYGDSDFRLLVDRTLAKLYRSGAIGSIFIKTFGKGRPSEILKVMYRMNALAE
jgi:ABC-type amino acid transport substrate-binding protein